MASGQVIENDPVAQRDEEAHLADCLRSVKPYVDEVIVVVDSTKFGHRSLAHLCELAAVDRMVSDDCLAESWRNRLVAAGVDLILAAHESHQQTDGADESR